MVSETKRTAGDKKDLERMVRKRVIRLNATVQGLTVGFLAGLGLFVATNWLILKGGEEVGKHLGLLGQYFIGYRVTFLGSFIGFAYGFVSGFAGTYLLARIYNWIVDFRYRGGPGEGSD